MIISKIIKDSCVYYSLHAEQSVTATFIEDTVGNGIFEEILTINTLDRVCEDFEKNERGAFNLVLDCSNLKSCQNNLKKRIIQLIKSIPKVLILINVRVEIIEKLEVDIFRNPNNSLDAENNFYNIFYVSENGEVNIQSVDLFEEMFVSYLKSHVKHNPDEPFYHHSSSVYLSTYINTKSMISADKGFFIYALYHLALKMKNNWSEIIGSQEAYRSDKLTLICQNLNSSYIASILSSFLKLDILVLDKLGPINKLYSTLDNKIVEEKNYIVVSDVVCLGTEIKIAKSLITFLGGKYLGNVSIIRIDTLDASTKIFDDTECVFRIRKGNNPINYQIKTALDL